MVATNPQPDQEPITLARRLRELRERAGLTQTKLGQALGEAEGPISPAAISMWENAASGRLPPRLRLEAYARLFCTSRSFDGNAHMLGVNELTIQERNSLEQLEEELIGLRSNAASRNATPSSREAQSMWHFPDGSRITLVCYRLPPDRRPPSAEPGALNYVKFAGLADLDTLIDIYGAVRAYNPTSQVVIMAAEDLGQRDVASHLVLIGGLTWKIVSPRFSRIFPVPIDAGDPADRGAIVVHGRNGEEREFKHTIEEGELAEDVGFFARGENPAAPQRTLTICGGITTRGVRGAARCFIDWEMKERNERYLAPRFPNGSTYCIVMRVPVFNLDPLTPDLSKEENRLFEWCDAEAE